MITNPVFILGVHRRCGSNFLADALALWPEFQVPQPITEDYLLQYSHLLSQYVDRTTEEQYRKRFSKNADFENCQSDMRKQLGSGLLAFLQSRIEPERRLLTKTPDPWNLPNFFRLFPESRLILMVRDGRDIVESSHRSWPDAPYSEWMKDWADGARTILDFQNGSGREHSEKWRLIRYEDLLEGRDTWIEILRFLEIDPDAFPWDQFDKLPLRGSSVHRGDNQDLNWKPVERPKNFKPIGRWAAWSRWRKWQFKRLAGRELIELGYVTGNSW